MSHFLTTTKSCQKHCGVVFRAPLKSRSLVVGVNPEFKWTLNLCKILSVVQSDFLSFSQLINYRSLNWLTENLAFNLLSGTMYKIWWPNGLPNVAIHRNYKLTLIRKFSLRQTIQLQTLICSSNQKTLLLKV